MFRKFFLPCSMLVALTSLLIACGGEVQEVVEEAVPTVQAVDTEIAPTLVAAATDAVAPAQEVATEVTGEPQAESMVEEPCSPSAGGELAGVDPRGQTVIWWHNHRGDREERLVALIARFNKTNECGIIVDPLNQGSYNDIRDKFNASVAAGELPPGLLVGYQNDQAFYQLSESLVDIDIYVNDPHWGLSDEEQADFYESFFFQSLHPAFDHQRLGFPPNRSMEVLYYNQTWLEELGFTGPPTTPEEFREMACAGAEANGDGTGGYILRDDASATAAWTFAFGGDVLTEDGSGYVYDGDATVEALTMLKELYDDGCAYFFTERFSNPEFAARRALFDQSTTVGIPFYAADIATFAQEEGRAPDVWGAAAIPHMTEEPVQNIYGGDIMITATTPEQQLAAWEFVKWFTSPQIQAEWVQISGYFPTRKGTNEYLGSYVEENPQWTQARDLLPYGYYEPQLISYEATRDAAQRTFNVIMQLAPGWSTEDIRRLLTELTETANELEEEMMAEIGSR